MFLAAFPGLGGTFQESDESDLPPGNACMQNQPAEGAPRPGFPKSQQLWLSALPEKRFRKLRAVEVGELQTGNLGCRTKQYREWLQASLLGDVGSGPRTLK